MKQNRNSFDNPIIVIANGSFPSHPLPLRYLKNHGTIICADGAADKLINYGKIPDIVIGDFDSTGIKNSTKVKKWIEVPNQNQTDLEKIFKWCINKNILNIVLLGASGKREDHTLGNLFTLGKYHGQLNCQIITNHSRIICVSGKNHIPTKIDQDVSIIAIEPIENITIEGLQYDMKNEKIFPSARAICNKAVTKQFYLESTGKVLIFLNHIK